MHIHDSYTRNGDNLHLLIKTGKAHKQRILTQTTINICNEGGEIESQSKLMMAAKWWAFSQLQKKTLNGKLRDLVRSLSYLYLRR